VKKAQLNLIDKAVAFLNPQGAVNRMIARQKLVNFSYDAVKYTRERKGPSQLSGAEDYHSNYDRVELMKRARDLAENVGLVRSILMKFASHTAANISYQARTENPEVNSDVEAYWSEWWDKCDISTRHTGSTLMQVAVMSMLRDGDFLFALVRDKEGDLKLQGIEADRVGDPFKVYTSLDLIGGIHIDRTTGAPSAYDIYSRSIGDFYTFQATIPASQAFHLFDPLRIDQYRGVSAFHTAINDCTDIYDIVNFEKMAARVASSQSAVVRRNNNNASDLSTLTNDENVNGDTIKLEAIESGKISYLEPGEDIVFPDGPSRPSGAFAEFHKILLRNICLGLGIPYSFAVDPSAMSGPTARLEMQQAGRTFRRYQKLIDDKVLRPIKNIVLADAVSRGLIENNLGSRTTKGIFNFGANVSIDLGRESASAISEFKTGLRTAADIYAERGQDFESAMRQRAIEAKLIKDLAEKYGVAPETISDIVTPTPPQPQQPPAPAPKPVAPIEDKPEEDEDEGGDQKPIPENPIDSDGQEVGLDCGTGAGGFQPGNSCAGGGGIQSSIRDATPSGYGPSTSSQEKTKEQRMRGESIDDAINRKVGYQVDNGRVKIASDQGGWVVSVAQPEGNPRKFRSANRQQAINQAYEELYPDTELIPHPSDSEAKPQKKSNLEILESLDPASIKMLIEGMMGGIELAKYDGIDFTPPEGAREAAKRALDVRETKPPSQRGMTPVGLARARDLINGVKMSPDTIKRMKAFFDRHEVDKKGSTFAEQGKGWQAWNGWGGDAGYSWARKVVGQMEARDKKELAEPETCPLPTQDIKTNLANRQTAVDDANYGPANPNEPNEDYWKAKADEFQGDVATAKKMLCGNCAAFNQTSKLLNCIKGGIGIDADEVAVAGDLGYCEIFDFKCAAKRTCDAWIVGGPITDKKEELARPVSQTPAPPKERIKGSKENPEGTASTRSKAGDIEISAENEEALKNKIAEFKDKHPSRKAPTLGALKKVFRRGAGAFSTSFRPTITGGKPNSRNAWAMARVNKFLKMAGGGEVKESYRKADGDLLEERFDCGTGAGGFKEGNTCAGGGNEESSSTKASAKSPELMTPEEFRRSAKIGKLQKATGKIVPGEEKAKTPLQIGELNKYSPKDIAHFYAKRDSYSKDKITDEGIKTGQARLITDAISLKRSINAKSVDQLKIKLPKSYILKDDKYIYKRN
jgi:lambda family phage portal protein